MNSVAKFQATALENTVWYAELSRESSVIELMAGRRETDADKLAILASTHVEPRTIRELSEIGIYVVEAANTNLKVATEEQQIEAAKKLGMAFVGSKFEQAHGRERYSWFATMRKQADLPNISSFLPRIPRKKPFKSLPAALATKSVSGIVTKQMRSNGVIVAEINASRNAYMSEEQAAQTASTYSVAIAAYGQAFSSTALDLDNLPPIVTFFHENGSPAENSRELLRRKKLLRIAANHFTAIITALGAPNLHGVRMSYSSDGILTTTVPFNAEGARIRTTDQRPFIKPQM